ncbi:hypothetical protein QJS04_geneDACA000083 [Acorus gramineus]|uniref:Uncharacterized protein n=1 Tax=Acorus gramineus TaxID=55184 RepID=A0AAV9AR19_ACOGR|nr:hypothetical protein QJS04_geneDACA000083 [Acorus gramineus]
MYPKVKVRTEDEPIVVKQDTPSPPICKFGSLSIEECYSLFVAIASGVDEFQDYSSPASATPSDTLPPRIPKPTFSGSKVKNNQEKNEDSRTNIRASSAPRPRAVISSPDNDGMIGSQNEKSSARRTIVRAHTPVRGTQSQGKVTSKTVKIVKPTNVGTIRTPNVADNKKNSKEKPRSSEPSKPRQAAGQLRKGKPNTQSSS